MESELKKMQEKLLVGGVNIKDRTTQREREIEIKRQKLAEERLKEREILSELQEQEEREENARESYKDLRQEVEVKTKKLKKLYNKLQSTKGTTVRGPDWSTNQIHVLFRGNRGYQ